VGGLGERGLNKIYAVYTRGLYRKYRSQTYADRFGNRTRVARRCKGAIIGGRVSHVYLFRRSAGTGEDIGPGGPVWLAKA